MARLGGLGKGLGALIPSEAGTIEGDVPRLVDLPIDSIIPNQHQPRVHFDEESLAELAARSARSECCSRCWFDPSVTAPSNWLPANGVGAPHAEPASL